MSRLQRILDPAGHLQRTADTSLGFLPLQRIEAELGRRPIMPRVALGIAAAGLTLVVVLTILAAAFTDNWAAGGGAALDAVVLRSWSRITLFTGAGIMLTGIITMLLAITARIWWVTFANAAFLPVVVDSRRKSAGRPPLFVRAPAAKNGGAS